MISSRLSFHLQARWFAPFVVVKGSYLLFIPCWLEKYICVTRDEIDRQKPFPIRWCAVERWSGVKVFKWEQVNADLSWRMS
jgi:hypothetical protein